MYIHKRILVFRIAGYVLFIEFPHSRVFFSITEFDFFLTRVMVIMC